MASQAGGDQSRFYPSSRDAAVQAPAPLDSIASVMRAVFGQDFEERFGRSLVKSVDGQKTFGVALTMDDTPVSSIIVHLDPPVLWGLCTTPDRREQGFASRVIDEALEVIAQLRPGEPVFTAVAIDGVWVRQRYERRGFRVIHDDKIPGHLLLMRGEFQT